MLDVRPQWSLVWFEKLGKATSGTGEETATEMSITPEMYPQHLVDYLIQFGSGEITERYAISGMVRVAVSLPLGHKQPNYRSLLIIDMEMFDSCQTNCHSPLRQHQCSKTEGRSFVLTSSKFSMHFPLHDRPARPIFWLSNIKSFEHGPLKTSICVRMFSFSYG